MTLIYAYQGRDVEKDLTFTDANGDTITPDAGNIIRAIIGRIGEAAKLVILSSNVDAIDISGDASPDVSGRYTSNDVHNGEPAYQRSDGAYWIWYQPPFIGGNPIWMLSTELGEGGAFLLFRKEGPEITGTFDPVFESTGTLTAAVSTGSSFTKGAANRLKLTAADLSAIEPGTYSLMIDLWDSADSAWKEVDRQVIHIEGKEG